MIDKNRRAQRLSEVPLALHLCVYIVLRSRRRIAAPPAPHPPRTKNPVGTWRVGACARVCVCERVWSAK